MKHVWEIDGSRNEGRNIKKHSLSRLLTPMRSLYLRPYTASLTRFPSSLYSRMYASAVSFLA